MTQPMVLDIMRNTFITILKLAGPILIISLITGLIISILQATTQIQEQTLSFVPKLLAVMLGLILLGSFMMNSLINFTSNLFNLIPTLG
ncbi:MAG TPA: flagellar biosynthesis protein FliQ [Tissierellaceae bacterium]|nr:flagellar biosynthesis protein FliQ [Tissierellaceae bacterium]